MRPSAELAVANNQEQSGNIIKMPMFDSRGQIGLCAREHEWVFPKWYLSSSVFSTVVSVVDKNRTRKNGGALTRTPAWLRGRNPLVLPVCVSRGLRFTRLPSVARREALPRYWAVVRLTGQHHCVPRPHHHPPLRPAPAAADVAAAALDTHGIEPQAVSRVKLNSTACCTCRRLLVRRLQGCSPVAKHSSHACSKGMTGGPKSRCPDTDIVDFFVDSYARARGGEGMSFNWLPTLSMMRWAF